MELKAPISPHVNSYVDQNDNQKDSTTAKYGLIRVIVSMVKLLPFRIVLVDIKGAYLQSGPIRRDVYVIPPL